MKKSINLVEIQHMFDKWLRKFKISNAINPIQHLKSNQTADHLRLLGNEHFENT